jgi:hypothetical protein
MVEPTIASSSASTVMPITNALSSFTSSTGSCPLVAPGAELLDRGLQDVAGQRRDEAGGLGDRDELVGRYQPVGGVLPAQQRLCPATTHTRWIARPGPA